VLYPDISFNSIDNLPYFNFVEVLKTGDLKWLGEQVDPSETWLNIQDEYCKAANVDNSQIKQQAIILSLRKKYDFISGCLEILRHSHLLREVEGFEETRQLAIEKIGGYGYLVDERKPFLNEFERLLNQLAGLKMKIIIEESKVEKVNKKQGISLWKELVYLEKVVQGVKVDPYKDPVSKVIEIKLLAKDIQNEQRNNRHNSRR